MPSGEELAYARLSSIEAKAHLSELRLNLRHQYTKWVVYEATNSVGELKQLQVRRHHTNRSPGLPSSRPL